MTIRVLIADDQALVREGFRLILERQQDIDVVADVADGLDAIEATRSLAPDVVLMDIRMPTLDGIEATRTILSRTGDHQPTIVVLTTFDQDEYVYDALRAGASGFLLKDVSPEQLVDAVRIVNSGQALFSPTITQRLIQTYLARRTSTDDGAIEALSTREAEVFDLMARGRSNVEIGDALFLAETTVKTHVAHILTKLGLRDRVHAVIYAYQHGLVRPGDHREGLEA